MTQTEILKARADRALYLGDLKAKAEELYEQKPTKENEALVHHFVKNLSIVEAETRKFMDDLLSNNR